MDPQPWKPGTRVKLNARGVRNQGTAHKRIKMDWAHRYGIFQRASKGHAAVLWDGRISIEEVPLAYLEPVTEEAPYLEYVR